MKEKDFNGENTDGVDDEIEFTTELDHEALNTILRLYDRTFKDLVGR